MMIINIRLRKNGQNQSMCKKPPVLNTGSGVGAVGASVVGLIVGIYKNKQMISIHWLNDSITKESK